MKRILCFLITLSVFSFAGCKSLKNTPKTEAEVPVQQEEINDDEFTRSTSQVSISREAFNADKKEILQIIAELATIMQDYDYESWLKYIDKDSINYWSNPSNLRNATKRLPNKAIKLNTLNDYFTYVFVPSRKERKVEEIRYISLDSVKAVQMREEVDVVYYNFVKINGKWMVKLPALSPSSN
ncbi:MAG: hypothetical protein IIT58_01870 [Treponema sp.]|nr:hypothetical protein [Treponema sp.]